MKYLHISKKLPFIFVQFLFMYCQFNLKAPPITFTQSQTISEKQMIGEDKELERDGWLIASIKSSSSGSELWKRTNLSIDSSEKNILILYKKLSYLEPELKLYKLKGVIGESYDGDIKFVPKASLPSGEELTRLKELITMVNNSRKELIQAQAKENPSFSLEQIKKSQFELRLQFLEAGEFFEESPGRWKKVE